MADTGFEIPYQVYPFNLTAGQEFQVPGFSRFIGVLTCTNATAIQIAFENGSYFTLPVGCSISEIEKPVKIKIKNNSGSTVTGTFASGNATFRDTRFTFDYSGTALPVTMADGASVALGSTTDAAASTDTGTFSLIALIKRLNTKLGSLGQQTMANSQPVVIASDQSNVGTNLKQLNGVTISVGSGTNGTGVQRFTLATDQAACSVAGLFSVKIDQTTQGTTNAVVSKVAASMGSTAVALNSAATTNAAFAKASAGCLFSISANNAAAAAKYVRFYNKASAPTVGTDVPIMVISLPALTSKEISFGNGKLFSTGIAYAITNLPAVLDATAVAAGDVQLAFDYA